MRILVLSVNYWPEATGIGALCTRRCEYLASRGTRRNGMHDISILSPVAGGGGVSKSSVVT